MKSQIFSLGNINDILLPFFIMDLIYLMTILQIYKVHLLFKCALHTAFSHLLPCDIIKKAIN